MLHILPSLSLKFMISVTFKTIKRLLQLTQSPTVDYYSFYAESCPSKMHMLRTYWLNVTVLGDRAPSIKVIKVTWNHKGGALTPWVNCLSRKRNNSGDLSLPGGHRKMPGKGTVRKCLLHLKARRFIRQLPWCHLELGLFDSGTVR